MVSPAVIVEDERWEFFCREQFPTDLSAGALTMKEATKARLNPHSEHRFPAPTSKLCQI